MSDSNEQAKLSPLERRFVDAYIGDAHFNATQAARIAGYTEKSAGQMGFRVKNRPNVRARIREALEEATLTREELLKVVAEDASRSDYQILDEARRLNSEIVASSLVSGLISSRTTARTNLMKAYGMFTENVNVSGSLRREIVLVDGDNE